MVWTMAVSLFNEFILRRLFFKQINLFRIIVWSTWSLVLIGLAVFLLYNYLGNWHDFSIPSALGFILDVSTVIVFPMLGTFFYYRYRLLHHEYLQLVNNKEGQVDPDALIHFDGQGTNDSLMIAIADFMYAHAQDNYVELIYHKQEMITKTLIRTSMSALLDSISSKMIVRCHRSYMVNLYQVRAIIDGTEMKLLLHHLEDPIIVSKSYRQPVHAQLKVVKNFD
jgi:hypothetical protein